MSEHDLLSMLDLAGKDARPSSETLAVEGLDATTTTAPSATALAVDEWGRQRAGELAAGNQQLATALGPTISDETINAVADFHTASFEQEPRLQPACTDQLRHAFCKTLLESADYQALHSMTALDPAASELATEIFLTRYAAHRRKTEQEKAKPKKAGKPDPHAATRKQMQLALAVGRAVDQAIEEVEAMRNACNAMGLGGDVPINTTMDAQKTAALFRKVRNSHKLRAICEWAGRFRRLASAKQRQKVTHGFDDMVGVELAGDVGRLLPHEMVKLADDDLELDTLRRLVERQTQCREYRGVEKVGKGPIVIVVDESGSMTGEKEQTAKALALTLAWVARRQNRWCCLIAFSGGSEGRLLTLPPAKWDDVKLMTWLEAFLSGGTICDVPLVELPNRYWPALVSSGLQRGKTDVICITDGIINVPAEVVKSFNAWKAREQAKLFTLIINAEPGQMAAVSDEVFKVQGLTADNTAVGQVLSI